MQEKPKNDLIKLGEPLAFDLKNSDGIVVFRKGFVVNTEASLGMMLNMGLYPSVQEDEVPPPPPAAAKGSAVPDINTEKGLAPLREIDRLADELDRCYTAICLDADDSVSAQDLNGLASAAHELFLEHRMACIASVHFRHEKSAACLHPLYSQFLIELFAPAFGDPAYVARLAVAALTANLGMYEFQHQWANQQGRLTDEQRKQLRSHPEVSVQRLKGVGFDDEALFSIVRQHHERDDGTGYPGGLCGEALPNEPLLLGLIDRYLSFVMPRADRAWAHPTTALKRIHEDGKAYRVSNINTFIQWLGVYPPGTSVRLNNGEIAVVSHHQMGKSTCPGVVSVASGADEFFEEPVQRDTSQKEYAVKGLYVPDLSKEVNPALMVRSWL